MRIDVFNADKAREFVHSDNSEGCPDGQVQKKWQKFEECMEERDGNRQGVTYGSIKASMKRRVGANAGLHWRGGSSTRSKGNLLQEGGSSGAPGR